jgi:ATP-dependent helicase/nuclease subunit A
MSERFLLRRDRVVQAGAGTGKTHALLTQYLHLCAGLSAHGAKLPPRAICALTFTDKAAGEMRERLQRRTTAIVRATAAATSRDELAAALVQLQEVDLLQTAAALERPLPELKDWEQILAQLPGAPIGTFHSFAASLLRRYAGLAGLDPDFTLLDEDSARALLVESSERVVLAALEGRLPAPAQGSDPSAEPTAEQAALLVSEYGFSGGPSAEGGTVEALCRLHRLRGEEGKDAAGLADSYRPAVLTAELARLRTALLGGLAELAQLAAQLGQGSAERVTELCGLRDALAASLRQPDEATLAAALPLAELLQQGLKKLRAKKDSGAQDELAELKERLKTAAEELTALHKSLRAAPLALALEALLGPVARAYGQAKQAASALDFTDLLRQARDLLRDQPAVRAEAQARFAVLLVDEFQDTNPLQAELLELLAGPLAGAPEAGASAGPREPGRLYIVGDRKQSIYEFRGADVAAYTTLCDRLLAGGADEETLSRSYRSRPPVLQFVSSLFAAVMSGAPPGEPAASSAEPAFFVRWDAQRDPLQAVRPAAPGASHAAVELVRSAARPASPDPASSAKGPPGEIQPAHSYPAEGHPAEGHTAKNRTAESRIAESRTAEGHAAEGHAAEGHAAEGHAAEGHPAEGHPAEGHPIDREAELLAQRILALCDEGERLGDQVVLLRRFTHLARYTQALKRAGIAHYVVRGRGFYQAQEVLDVAALLTLLSDPEDRLALLTLLRSPLCGLSDDSLLQLHLEGRLNLGALLRERRAAGGHSASLTTPLPTLSEDELGPPLELLAEGRAAVPRLGLPADEAARLGRLLGLIEVLLRLGDRLGPSACLQLLYDHTDLLAILAADPDGEQRVANLLRLHERARAFDRSGGLRAFGRALRLATDPQLKAALASPGDEPAAQIAGEADDVVRIMTVHQAKGLEFPIVLVAGCTTRERTDSPAVAYDRAVGLGLTIYEEGERVRTLAARQLDASARRRASAESARLFYVAATRARERLIFLGEPGPRPRLGGTWRAHLDALLAAQEASLAPAAALPPLLAEGRPHRLPPPPSPPPSRDDSAVLRQAARSAAALVYQNRLPPAADGAQRSDPEAAPRLPTAAAADLLVCPRRFHLRMTARLFPPGPAARPALSDEAAGATAAEQLRSGSLAARLLAQADPARGGQDLAALLLASGVDPGEPRAVELTAHLQRFGAAPRRHGSQLAALLQAGPGQRVQRALPYAVTVGGGTVRLRGVLDLVHQAAAADGVTVTVLDYHYCCAPEVEGPLHAERRALLGLVAAQLYPEARWLRTGLCFLRDADPEPVLRPLDPAVLAAAEVALGQAAPASQLPLPAALRLPVLSPRTCAALACEYQPLCHAGPSAATARAEPPLPPEPTAYAESADYPGPEESAPPREYLEPLP